jgi:hypothetical protein
MAASTVTRLDVEVVEVLRASSIQGPALKLNGQLDRKLYEKTNKILVALGGKWNRKAGAHLFEEDPGAVIQEAMEAGSVVDSIKTFQFYPTPLVVAQELVLMAKPQPGDLILEPEAGSGAILDAMPGLPVHVCEIQPKLREGLAKRPGVTVVGEDFLAYEPGPIYNCIVANPPFSKGQDVRHANHMLDLLAPGGRMACIMAAGVDWRQDRLTLAFLERVRQVADTHLIRPLESGAFRESGTMVNTVALALTLKS